MKISIASQKGGVGKTSVLEHKPLPIHQTSVPNLSLVPSHILLSNTDIELTTANDHREARLKTELEGASFFSAGPAPQRPPRDKNRQPSLLPYPMKMIKWSGKG
jgi:cellulose biosynthesis protein BcsQ